MSLLSARLRQRVVTTSSDPVTTSVRTLADLAPGECGRIVDVWGGHDAATARRLIDLGFAPGSSVSVVRRAPMADPVIFRVAGGDVALRRAQARFVHVRDDG